MRSVMSCSVAKLALPITRFSIIRPATETSRFSDSRCSLLSPSYCACRSPASAVRRKSLGKALPLARRAVSLARSSATIWFSSGAAGVVALAGGAVLFLSPIRSHSLLQTGGDEILEVAVQDALRVAHFVIGAQVLDARLVEHVRADLVAPADVGL